MRKKILLPTPDYAPKVGGVARYLLALKQTFPDQVSVLYWPNDSMPHRAALRRALRERSTSFDEIWTSHVVPIGTALFINRLFGGKPYTVILHGMDFDLARRNPLRCLLTYLILRSASQVVTNSDALAEEVRVFCSVRPLVVYPTITDELVHVARTMFVRHRTDGVLRLLTVARLVERKGHLEVLQAIKDLSNVSYTIIGNGPMEVTIRNTIQTLHLEDRVRIEIDVPDEALPKQYVAHDVFVMPTKKTDGDREGFGIVYLEANLFGLPVIATRHPGVDEAVLHGVTGLLTDGSVEALKKAIMVLQENPERREKLGKTGRERARGLFTREAQFGKLKQLINR